MSYSMLSTCTFIQTMLKWTSVNRERERERELELENFIFTRIVKRARENLKTTIVVS